MCGHSTDFQTLPIMKHLQLCWDPLNRYSQPFCTNRKPCIFSSFVTHDHMYTKARKYMHYIIYTKQHVSWTSWLESIPITWGYSAKIMTEPDNWKCIHFLHAVRPSLQASCHTQVVCKPTALMPALLLEVLISHKYRSRAELILSSLCLAGRTVLNLSSVNAQSLIKQIPSKLITFIC